MSASEAAIAARAGPVVAELLRRMLDPDPAKRPQTARGVMLELLRRESPHALLGEDEEEERRQLTRVLLEQVPFVDRGGHLAALLELAGAALVPGAGVARCVLIEAPKGLGKRTLMAELRRDLQLRGLPFFDISAWDDHEGMGAFSSVVTQLSTALPEEGQESFSRLFEIVRDRRGESIEPSSIVDFLLACAAKRPFVLHFAELARSTEFARQVFEQLARAIVHYDAPVLLCATAVPHAKLARATQQLQREGLLEIRSLRPFSSADTRALTRGIFADSPMIGPLAELLDDLTGGHPLGVRETLRLLLEESIVAREGGDWVLRDSRPAAETLHEALAERTEARIDGIGVAAWELAATLHLVGESVHESALAELADLRRGRFGRILERLEAEGLITRIAAGGATEVALAHRSVHEAVQRRYRASLDETRMDLAARIEELDTDDPRLLFLRGKLLDDASGELESVETLEELYDRLCDLGQARLGGSLLDRVIRRRRAHGGLEGSGRLLKTILMLRQKAGGALEDSREETAHYEAGVLLAQLLGNHWAEALLCLGLADRFVGDTGEDVERELRWLERAAKAVTLARDRRLELRIANRRAEILVTIGQIEEAGQQSAKAMEILDMEDPADVDVCDIIGVRIRCLTFAGEFEEANRLHEVGKAVAARVPVVQRQAYLSGISLLASTTEPTLAIPELVTGIEELRQAGAARLLRTPVHNLGDLYLASGKAAEAAECFREALGLAVLHGVDYDGELNRGFLGYALARLGEVDTGARLLREAKEKMYALVGEHFGSHQLRILDSEVAHLLGHTERARQELEEVAAEFSAEQQQSLARLARAALSRIDADVGRS
jgi:tetratricopeptide (TPR) repeat protein